jgi:hypothetical protein
MRIRKNASFFVWGRQKMGNAFAQNLSNEMQLTAKAKRKTSDLQFFTMSEIMKSKSSCVLLSFANVVFFECRSANLNICLATK